MYSLLPESGSNRLYFFEFHSHMRTTHIPLIALLLLCVACSQRKDISPRPSISEDSIVSLDKEINCSTARSDIDILENERASVGRQILSGVRSVIPFSAVAAIIMGDYRERVQVATGQYNDDIESKILEIKSSCGIS